MSYHLYKAITIGYGSVWTFGECLAINFGSYNSGKDYYLKANFHSYSPNWYVNKVGWYPVIGKSVSICTGLKDCHGQYVYEGDILAMRDDSKTPKIVIDRHLCSLVVHDIETGLKEFVNDYNRFQNYIIIGHKYTTPQFLKDINFKI